MTLPRTGQRKVGSAPVASLALRGDCGASSSAAGLAWASRALCCGAAAAILAPGAAGTVATGWAAATVAGTAAAVALTGTLSRVPSLSLAAASRLLALASSATERWLRWAMLASVSPGLTMWTLGATLATATGLLGGATAARAAAGAAAIAPDECGMISCWPGDSERGPL